VEGHFRDAELPGAGVDYDSGQLIGTQIRSRTITTGASDS
jgi:hypothetical protein